MRNFVRAQEKSPILSVFPLDVYEKKGYITKQENKQETAT